jgi:hypothetical protein
MREGGQADTRLLPCTVLGFIELDNATQAVLCQQKLSTTWDQPAPWLPLSMSNLM